VTAHPWNLPDDMRGNDCAGMRIDRYPHIVYLTIPVFALPGNMTGAIQDQVPAVSNHIIGT
jgi:hypothetical protein